MLFKIVFEDAERDDVVASLRMLADSFQEEAANWYDGKDGMLPLYSRDREYRIGRVTKSTTEMAGSRK